MGDRTGGFGSPLPAEGICGLAPPNARFQAPATARANLIANAGAGAGTQPPDANFVPLVQPQASASWPRCVTAQTTDGYPFDLRIEWTNGQAAWIGPVTITAPGGACRVYMDATAMRISAGAWENHVSQIIVGVANREGSNSDPRRVIAVQNIPAAAGGVAGQLLLAQNNTMFGEHISCVCSNPAQLPNIDIEFRDPAGVVHAAFPANQQFIPVPPLFTGNAAPGGIFAVNHNPAIVAMLYVSFHLSW